MATASPQMSLHQRNLLFFATPSLWPIWPYLPLVRRRPGQEEEYGVLVDVMKLFEVPGHSSTVFLSILFLMPADLDQMLELPKEVYDTPDEIFAAGWRVDRIPQP
jgi:hypothetical protein